MSTPSQIVPFGELEGHKPHERTSRLNILMLGMGIAAIAGFLWMLPLHSLKPFQKTEVVNHPKRPNTRVMTRSINQPKLGLVFRDAKNKQPPEWLRQLLSQWRQSWQKLAEHPLPDAAIGQLRDMYHADFKDVTTRRGRDAQINQMANRAKNCSWVRIHLSQFLLQAESPTEVFIQFYQKKIASTLRATRQGDQDVKGEIVVETGIKILQWRHIGDTWKIWRTFWYPSPAPKIGP